LHAAGTYEVYRDGILFASGSYTAITSNNNHFSVGSNYDGTTHTLPFEGALDDAAVFNRSFTAEEVNNVARLKSGIYYWYMNITDNTTANGASEIRTFIVDRYPNVTSISLAPSPNANTDDQFTCSYTVLDDISDSLTGDIKFYNGTTAAETFAGESFNNGTQSSVSATLGLQAKNETWRCELSSVADGVAATHGYGDGRNSSTVRTVNTPPSAITLFEPVHGNVTVNTAPRFRWSYFDADNDQVNFSLQLICYNGTSGAKCPFTGDDRNTTITVGAVTQNATTFPESINFYNDDNFYYNWTVNATDGENSTVNARPNNLSVSTLIDISMFIANVSFGTLADGDFDNTTDDSPLPLKINNDGNSRIDINISGDGLFTSVNTLPDDYQFYINETYDDFDEQGIGSAFDFNTINLTLSLLNVTNVTGSPVYRAISFFNYSSGSDTVAVNIRIRIPVAEPGGFKRSVLNFTAWYPGYI